MNIKVMDTGEVGLTISPSTKIPIDYHLLESIDGRDLYKDSPLNEVSNIIIEKKIKNYQYQDKRARREVSTPS